MLVALTLLFAGSFRTASSKSEHFSSKGDAVNGLSSYEVAAAELLAKQAGALQLLEQIRSAKVKTAQHSEIGSFKELVVPGTVLPVRELQDETLSGVDVVFDSGSICAAVLFIKNGYVDALEIVSLDGPFPSVDQPFSVSPTTVIDPGGC